MSVKKTKTTKKGKTYHLEFSVTSAFFWSLGLFFLLGWIFVLGVLVGRGFLPEGVKTLTEMKAQIARLQEMMSRRDSSDVDVIKKLDKDPKFEFYKELSTKKEEVANKSQPIISTKEHHINKGGEDHLSGPQKGYIVQVASLESEIKAKEMVNQLSERSYPAYFYKVAINGKTYFRVRCGIFHTEEEARVLKTRLEQKEGITGFVTKVEN